MAEDTPENVKPARLIQVAESGDRLVVVDFLTGNVLMTGSLATLLTHHPDAIVTPNAEEFDKKLKEQKDPQPKVIRVKGEGADFYWQRNNTCVDYLKRLILTKMSEGELKKKTWGCHNIEGITEEFMDECWRTGVEHPEWFGHSDYYIKPYLALCFQLGLGDQAYQFLNEGTAFPRMPPEEVIQEDVKQESEQNQASNPSKQDTPSNTLDLPCETEECDKCPDPCTDKCSMGISPSQAGKDEACLTCQVRECENVKKEQPKTQKQTTLF